MAMTTSRVTPGTDETPRIVLLAPLPIGDTIFCAPTIHALRQAYPRSRICALVHSTTADLMRTMSDVDEVMILPIGRDWRGPRALWRFLRRLRAARFDVSIDFSSPAYKWISLLTAIPTRTYMKFDRGWWFLPGRHHGWRRTHASQHYYDCVRELGLRPWKTIPHTARLRLPAAARREGRRYLAAQGLAHGRGRVLAIHPGGAMLDGLKRWPAERFAEVADALSERWGARVVLVGGPDEKELVEAVASHMTIPAIQAAGAVSLLATFALLAEADLFIGNDSGLLHAAAALGAPYVGIYGPTAATNFHPLPRREGQGVIVQPRRPCETPRYFVGGDVIWSQPCCAGVCQALSSISAERVLAVASMLLQRRITRVEAVS